MLKVVRPGCVWCYFELWNVDDVEFSAVLLVSNSPHSLLLPYESEDYNYFLLKQQLSLAFLQAFPSPGTWTSGIGTGSARNWSAMCKFGFG
jgi:hypothetical protein